MNMREGIGRLSKNNAELLDYLEKKQHDSNNKKKGVSFSKKDKEMLNSLYRMIDYINLMNK